jgi:hypothetical protein
VPQQLRINNSNNNNNKKGGGKEENVAVLYQLMHHCLISELYSSLSGAGRTWFRVHDTAQVIWCEITSTGKAATEKKTINSPQNTGNRCSLLQGFTELVHCHMTRFRSSGEKDAPQQ